MPVRHKPGSKPYRDQLRASLSAMGAQGLRLTELAARDLLLHGTRPRQAWRYAAELSQREAAGRFNQLTGNPRAPMTGNRIGDYEQWPDGGVRPTIATLKILADAYGTIWDQLVDARDLAEMPDSDRLEYLERAHSLATARKTFPAAGPVSPPRGGTRRQVSRDDLIAVVADESQELGEWAGMSEVADATIEQYASQVRHLARVFEYEMSFPLLMETRRLRDRVTARLRGHQRLDQARDLYLLASRNCWSRPAARLMPTTGRYRRGSAGQSSTNCAGPPDRARPQAFSVQCPERPGPVHGTSPVSPWRYWTGNAALSSPAVADGTVYAGHTGSDVSNFDAATGRPELAATSYADVGGEPG